MIMTQFVQVVTTLQTNPIITHRCYIKLPPPLVSVDRSQDQLTIVLASTFAIILLFVIVAGVTLTIGMTQQSIFPQTKMSMSTKQLLLFFYKFLKK